MKTRPLLSSDWLQPLHLTAITLLAALLLPLPVRAGLTLDLRLIREQQGNSYYFYAPVETNATAPAAPLGTYLISSPQYPANGTWQQFELTAAGLVGLGGGNGNSSDFASVMNQITNGNWSIIFTNATTTNHFHFSVSVSGLTSNMLPATSITFPTNGAVDVTNQPTCTWQGPASWGVNIDAFLFTNGFVFQYDNLPPTQTSWTVPAPIPAGPDNLVYIRYITNYAAPLLVASTPLNTNSAQPISGWVSTSALESLSYLSFAVTNPPGNGNVSLFGHYTFDDEFFLEADSSGLNNHAVNVFFTGGSSQFPQYTATGISGGAVGFDGENGFWWESDMVNVLSGSYSISLWLETSQSYGSDTDDARNGAAIFAGDDTGAFPVPMALTGDKVGFHTAVPDHTVNSTSNINSGNFTHLVVTRDAVTGLKRIYVDGVLDVSGTGGTAAGIDSLEVYLGYSYYSGQGIVGVVDDLQVYTGVLDASQIDFLYNNPGTTAPITGGVGGHTNIAHYRFDDSGNLGLDDSGNNNHFSSGSSWGLPVHEYDLVGAAGSGGVRFYGVSSMVHAPPNPVFTNITSVLADSFSLSLWVKTEAVVGSDTDNAFDGAVVIWHFASNLDDNIPVSITGTKVAFHTGDEPGIGSTLHSTNNVTDGNYHQVVVTRDRSTGEKKIYVDGLLDATEIASTRVLNGNNSYFSIGGTVDHDFDGTVDDVQIYSGVLSAPEVAGLYNNPGTVAPDTTGGGGNAAPVQLINPQSSGGNFQFQFLSQSGRTNIVQSRTNLTLGVWIDRTNILGDGSIKTVILPVSSAPTEFFRVSTE